MLAFLRLPFVINGGARQPPAQVLAEREETCVYCAYKHQ